MSGYFSQLAHHTGLNIEPPVTRAAKGFETEPTIAIHGAEKVPPESMHVEEIAFTAAPAPRTVEGSSETHAAFPDRDRVAASTPRHTEPKDDDHLHSDAATAKRSIDVSSGPSWEGSGIAFTDAASARNSPERSSVEPFPTSKPPATRPDDPSAAEQRSLPQESVAIPYDSIEAVDSQSAARDAQTRSRDEAVERETIVRNYLQEVRAWVSAPPEIDQRELDWQRDADRPAAARVAERSLVSRSDVFTLEHDVQPATPQPARSESLEVQDLNLSIGTISVVIEEPKQIAHAAVPTPRSMDSSSGSQASEPTRLSRYYLERW